MQTTPCPKCRRPVEQAGQVTFDGVTWPVFQCDNPACEEQTLIGGEPFPTAFTFALNAAG